MVGHLFFALANDGVDSMDRFHDLVLQARKQGVVMPKAVQINIAGSKICGLNDLEDIVRVARAHAPCSGTRHAAADGKRAGPGTYGRARVGGRVRAQKWMVQTNFNNYVVGQTRRDVTSDFLGRGIFTEDDAFWRTQRYLAKPAFENQRLEAMLPVFAEHAATVVKILADAAQRRVPVEMENLFMRYAPPRA